MYGFILLLYAEDTLLAYSINDENMYIKNFNYIIRITFIIITIAIIIGINDKLKNKT